MFKYLKEFFEKLNNPPEDITKLIEDVKHVLKRKGFGTPELELKFMHQIFLYFQSEHPDFKSFAWKQSNSYNDNYYFIQLMDFIVNDNYYVDSNINFYFSHYPTEELQSHIVISSIEDPDPDEIEFNKENGNLKDDKYSSRRDYYEKFLEYRIIKYKYLNAPCLKMLSLLKLLEINFSMYYFLYAFGNGVEVRFDSEGVKIIQTDQNEIEGSDLGEGMEFIS